MEPMVLQVARQLAEGVEKVHPGFSADIFVEDVAGRKSQESGWVGHITATLRDYPPPDYPAALETLLRSLDRIGPAASGWDAYAPISCFVGRHGLDHFPESMEAFRRIAPHSGSGPVPFHEFLAREPERSLTVAREWVRDEDPCVRRFAVEATRPRLPRKVMPGIYTLRAFVADPASLLNLLEPLKSDPSPEVRKAVAGSLSDILKDNPDVTYERLERWKKESSRETLAILRQALRYSVKQGNPSALRLLDLHEPQVTLLQFRIEPSSVRIGTDLILSFGLRSNTQQDQKLTINYRLHRVTATGRTGSKVFHLSTRTLKGGQSIELRKAHSFGPLHTRRYYPGQHRVELQVNGEILAGVDFEVRA